MYFYREIISKVLLFLRFFFINLGAVKVHMWGTCASVEIDAEKFNAIQGTKSKTNTCYENLCRKIRRILVHYQCENSPMRGCPRFVKNLK